MASPPETTPSSVGTSSLATATPTVTWQGVLPLHAGIASKADAAAPMCVFPNMMGNCTLVCHRDDKEIQREIMPDADTFFHGETQVTARVIPLAAIWAAIVPTLPAPALYRVGMLKIDVEGSELDVLHSVAPSCWPQVRQVVVEVMDVADRVARVAALLRGFEFVTTVCDADHGDGNCLVVGHRLR